CRASTSLTRSSRPPGSPRRAALRSPGLSRPPTRRPSRSSSSPRQTTTCSMQPRAPLSAHSGSNSPASSTSQPGEWAGRKPLQRPCDPEVAGDDDLRAVSVDCADDCFGDLVWLENETASEPVREQLPLWEAGRLDRARVDGVHADSPRGELAMDA